MKRLHIELVLALQFDEPHRRPRRRFRDPLGVAIVVLLRLDIGPDIFGRHQPQVVVVSGKHAAEMVSSAASLHRHDARRKLRRQHEQGLALRPTPEHYCARGVQTDHAADVLPKIDAKNGNRLQNIRATRFRSNHRVRSMPCWMPACAGMTPGRRGLIAHCSSHSLFLLLNPGEPTAPEGGAGHSISLPARLEEIGREAGVDADRIEVWFADEARIGQKNKITRRWPNGARGRAPRKTSEPPRPTSSGRSAPRTASRKPAERSADRRDRGMECFRSCPDGRQSKFQSNWMQPFGSRGRLQQTGL